MKRVIIVGAGGFGREIHGWAQMCPDYNHTWKVVGFLDDGRTEHDARCVQEPPILGTVTDYQPAEDEELLLAIGSPEIKLALARQLEDKGARFRTFIHPSVLVAPSCTIGRGSILCPYVVIGAYASIGAFVTLNLHSTVGHDATVGDGVTLSCHCDVSGFAVLERGAFLGSHASVLPSVKVGTFATLGAGSTATRTLKARTTYFGLPAKPLFG